MSLSFVRTSLLTSTVAVGLAVAAPTVSAATFTPLSPAACKPAQDGKPAVISGVSIPQTVKVGAGGKPSGAISFDVRTSTGVGGLTPRATVNVTALDGKQYLGWTELEAGTAGCVRVRVPLAELEEGKPARRNMLYVVRIDAWNGFLNNGDSIVDLIEMYKKNPVAAFFEQYAAILRPYRGLFFTY